MSPPALPGATDTFGASPRRLVLLLVEGFYFDPGEGPPLEGATALDLLGGSRALASTGEVVFGSPRRDVKACLHEVLGAGDPEGSGETVAERLVRREGSQISADTVTAGLLAGRGITLEREVAGEDPGERPMDELARLGTHLRAGVEASRGRDVLVLSSLPGFYILHSRERPDARLEWWSRIDDGIPHVLLALEPGDALILVGTPPEEHRRGSLLAFGRGFRPRVASTEPWDAADVGCTIAEWFRLEEPFPGRSFLPAPLEEIRG